jgi:hypothetical protein
VISGRELAIGVYGAWRLLHFERAAIQYFDSTIDGFWKSFYAALVVIPAVIVLRLLFLSDNPDIAAAAGSSRIAIVFTIDYVYQWVLFPLVMINIAEGIGRGREYTAYIVARNWSQVVQVAIILPAAVFFVLSGSGESSFGRAVLIAAHMATWVYGWFIARSALDISGIAAALIVLVELVISVAISVMSELLIRNV